MESESDKQHVASSSCAQIRQYRIPDGSEFMKFSVRIPILNFRKYSTQVRAIPENSESAGIRVLHSDSQTYDTDEYYRVDLDRSSSASYIPQALSN